MSHDSSDSGGDDETIGSDKVVGTIPHELWVWLVKHKALPHVKPEDGGGRPSSKAQVRHIVRVGAAPHSSGQASAVTHSLATPAPARSASSACPLNTTEGRGG
jgi:hypothetical protein